jgi:hypothetical protein
VLALAGPLLAADAPAKKACPCDKCDCSAGGLCECKGACQCPACPLKGKTIHVSPDGTVNELCKDGVYRAIPGVAKQKPQAVQSATPLIHAYPTYRLVPSYLPSCNGPSCVGTR